MYILLELLKNSARPQTIAPVVLLLACTARIASYMQHGLNIHCMRYGMSFLSWHAVRLSLVVLKFGCFD